MIPKSIAILIAFLMSASPLFSQGKISGKVFDKKSGSPIEYATVAVLNAKDSSIVTGTVSESNGSFSVKVANGRYLVRVSFMGYATFFYPNILAINEKQSSISLGKIMIEPNAVLINEVVVTSERTMVEYQLDKRVVNVDKNIISSGGTATDVLEQVPSVSVDNDGNVSLRGSSNVKVLINGRPYELMGNDLETLLEQIPASTVESVEVITNPSAKYDPEGMSGIINIKLKDKTTGALGLNPISCRMLYPQRWAASVLIIQQRSITSFSHSMEECEAAAVLVVLVVSDFVMELLGVVIQWINIVSVVTIWEV